MKKYVLTILHLLICVFLFSQSPQAFKYQGVARNTSGEIISNQSIGIQIGIREVSPTSTIIFKENHATSTNQFGIFDIEIGNEVGCIKNDDKIYYDRRAGFNIELEDNIYTVIKEGDVVIVL